jgi:hypothetical protein
MTMDVAKGGAGRGWARGGAGDDRRGGLPRVPRVGRPLGEARAAGLGRGDRHGPRGALADRPDPVAPPAGEAPPAALDDRDPDDDHRAAGRVDRPPAGGPVGPGDGGPGLRPGPADRRAGGRARGGAGPGVVGLLHRRVQAGRQRRPLAFFATLALYAAWRRLEPAGGRRWALAFHAAMGPGVPHQGAGRPDDRRPRGRALPADPPRAAVGPRAAGRPVGDGPLPGPGPLLAGAGAGVRPPGLGGLAAGDGPEDGVAGVPHSRAACRSWPTGR